MDPAGMLTVYEPAVAARPAGLISPNWHSYDAWLPARGGAEDTAAVAAVLDAFQDAAAQCAAPWYGLVNVDATGPLGTALTSLGAHGLPIDQRYVLDLPPGFGLPDYVDGLGTHERFALLSHQTWAARAGAVVRVLEPEDADLDAHLELVRASGFEQASGTEGVSGPEYGAGADHWAPCGAFQEFQLRMGDAARIIEVCLNGRVAGVGICLLDARRLHLWACAVDNEAAGGEFEPLFVVFLEALRLAMDLGVSSLECGGHHGGFKRRYGLRPVPLLAYLAPTGRPLGTRP
jgi:hypothetical protein